MILTANPIAITFGRYELENDLNISRHVAQKIYQTLRETRNERDVDNILNKVFSLWDENSLAIVPYGLESVRCENCWRSEYWTDIVAVYINTGNTYTPTILYNVPEKSYEITSWGDFFEYHEKSHQEYPDSNLSQLE